MSGPGADLQSILARHDIGALNPRERQVVSHVRSCRTAALGGLRWGCDRCEHGETHFHSCRDRHCPKCQRQQSMAWRERQRADVLPVTYHHVVFTLPSALNGWVGLHPEVIYRTLFGSAWKTLAAFGADPKRLDGQIGMTAVLHTWGEALTRHVHLHCLVPGGALGADGQWHPARSHYLFPVRALSRRFRGTMVSALRQAANDGELHRVIREGEIDALLAQLMESEWVVYSKACPGRAEQVVDYLGRYTHRIAISDERIVKADEAHVSFRVKDYAREGVRRTLTLGSGELQVGQRLYAVGLRALDQREVGGHRPGTVGGVGEQPALSPDRQRPDRVLGQHVADPQLPVLGVALELPPLVERVVHRPSRQRPLGHLRCVDRQPPA